MNGLDPFARKSVEVQLLPAGPSFLVASLKKTLGVFLVASKIADKALGLIFAPVVQRTGPHVSTVMTSVGIRVGAPDYEEMVE